MSEDANTIRSMSMCACCQGGSLADTLMHDAAAVVGSDSFIPTPELIERLIEHNPAQWSSANHYGRDLTAQRLGRILAREIGIHSTRDHMKRRGYCASVFRSTGEGL